PKHPLTASNWVDQALVMRRLGDRLKARTLLARSVATLSDSGTMSNPGVMQAALQARAELEWDFGARDSALAFALQGQRLARKNFIENIVALPEAEALVFFWHQGTALGLALTTLTQELFSPMRGLPPADKGPTTP